MTRYCGYVSPSGRNSLRYTLFIANTVECSEKHSCSSSNSDGVALGPDVRRFIMVRIINSARLNCKRLLSATRACNDVGNGKSGGPHVEGGVIPHRARHRPRPGLR